MTQAEIQAYVQKKQAACGADQGCLMKLAYEAQDLMANMNTGGATAAGNPGAYTGDEPERYYDYFGFDKCGASAHYYVDRTTQGVYADVQGSVPYTVVDKADYRQGDALDLPGAAPVQEVPALLAKAQMVVMPSRWAEPFGLVAI